MTPTSRNEPAGPARPATPFGTILIANRGEVALRVMRSARALGCATVAVYSKADAAARHVALADMAVCIGEAPAQASYLNIPAILDAAARCGADAVHPGYGFLAENAAFARACRAAGLVFIGPAPESIALMGDKAAAKARMQQAGLPCIPGWQGEAQDDARLLAEAGRIGFPVMIKARAGGGGRGMRMAASAGEFMALLASARSEARGAFGDDAMLLERALRAPRHVEIQILADRHGRVVHLGERDCSVQRRHQKLIEEAPSPAVTPALRERMGRAAVQAVQAIGYEGLGTLEFLLDAEGDFWFMEMNTRLQVEHGVTEAITGIDLVEWQLRIAAGEALALTQDAVRFDGHAIEARLCAEDPAAGFAPRSGRVLLWQPQTAAARVDSALDGETEIPPDYDSLLAKLIVHGRSREEALRKLARTLDDSVILGVPTNRAFLAACLRHPTLAAGEATTAFIDTHAGDLAAGPADSACQAVAALLMVLGAQPASAQAPLARMQHRAHALDLEIDGVRKPVVLTVRSADSADLMLDGRLHRLQIAALAAHSARIVCDGIGATAAHARGADGLWVQWRGRTLQLRDAARPGGARAAAARAGSGTIVAGMNGRVVQLLGRAGEFVHEGQAVFSIEAMKMEHVYSATLSGRIAALHAAEGQLVRAGDVIAEIEPEPTP